MHQRCLLFHKPQANSRWWQDSTCLQARFLAFYSGVLSLCIDKRPNMQCAPRAENFDNAGFSLPSIACTSSYYCNGRKTMKAPDKEPAPAPAAAEAWDCEPTAVRGCAMQETSEDDESTAYEAELKEPTDRTNFAPVLPAFLGPSIRIIDTCPFAEEDLLEKKEAAKAEEDFDRAEQLKDQARPTLEHRVLHRRQQRRPSRLDARFPHVQQKVQQLKEKELARLKDTDSLYTTYRTRPFAKESPHYLSLHIFLAVAERGKTDN